MYQIITEHLEDDAILWKYMDVAKFVSLLCQKSLWIARSDTFDDKKEGIFHERMKTELDRIYKHLKRKNKIIGNSNEFQSYLSNNTYINCWHKNSTESMVMWEIYGKTENSIAIKTTANKLKNSFCLKKAMKFAIEVALDDVDYIDHASATLQKNYRQPFFIKRPHYSFENEVRLYMRARNAKPRSKSPLSFSLPVDLSILIENIYVHPDAGNWFFDAIQDLAIKYDITAEVTKGRHGNKI